MGIVFADDVFTNELTRGRSSELAVALRFLRAGFWVKSPDAPFFGREPGTSMDCDLLVGIKQACRIEVKGRDVFHSDDPTSYPYTVAFLDSVSSYDRKEAKPFAYVLRSELTGGMIVAPGAQDAWSIQDCPDKRLNGRTQASYVIPRARLITFDALLASLQPEPFRLPDGTVWKGGDC